MQSSSSASVADYYSLLNIEPTASTSDIQKAYKALSKTFHPDRLRVASRHDLELARETFVQIKTAHDILCDPVYRFAYDEYGHEGVRFLRQCQQYKEGRQSNALLLQQQQQLPLDMHLYSKLSKILLQLQHQEQIGTTSGEEEDFQLIRLLALRILKESLERYRQHVQVLKQRLQDSAFTFEATLEFPCAHHPQAADAANENEAFVPYLELEQAELDFTIRTTNKRRQPIQNPLSTDDDNYDHNDDDEQSTTQSRLPQRHIYTSSLGATTQWDSTGKCGAELALGTDYQLSPASKTTWSAEIRAPITQVSANNNNNTSVTSSRPVKYQISSTHEFVTGTIMNAGIRGTNVSRHSWEYYVTSFRKLSIGWLKLDEPSSSHPSATLLTSNLKGTCAMGMKLFSGQPLFGFVTLTTIPPPTYHLQHDNQNDEHTTSRTTFISTIQSILSSPWTMSIPELSIRAGYHPSPLLASLKYDTFGKPWASLFASWAWNANDQCSKIKVLLSTDLWGIFRDNDTTTIRTGVRHDMISGWIWLWEWEEMDVTLKVPISLSLTKNNEWIAAAMMGSATHNDDRWHTALGSVLASYIVYTVARSMLSDWTITGSSMSTKDRYSTQSQHKAANAKRAASLRDDKSQDSFQLNSDEGDTDDADEGLRIDTAQRKQIEAFQSLMSTVAVQKKRASLMDNANQKDILVIRLAKVNTQHYNNHDDPQQKQRIASLLNNTNDNDHVDLDSLLLAASQKMTRRSNTVDVTNILQFWVTQNGTLNLPPLSTQTAPYYYIIGGNARRSNMENNANIDQSSSMWSLFYDDISRLWKNQIQPLWHHWFLPRGSSTDDTMIKSTTTTTATSTTTRKPRTTLTSVVIRYEWNDNVYEIAFDEDEPIVLPHSKALLLGPASKIQ